MAVFAQHDTVTAGPDGLVGVLLAGGRGARLGDLTARESKPAVTFIDGIRIVDYVMANALRSKVPAMLVCTQWQPETLVNHLQAHWRAGFDQGLVFRDGRLLSPPDGYKGTAHAVACNCDELEAAGTRELLVLAGDHIYDMDYRDMLAAHHRMGFPVTVAALPVVRSAASAFGVFETYGPCHARRFLEKPAEPPAMHNDAGRSLISMGIYIFNWQWLRRELGCTDGKTGTTPCDFGSDLLPAAVNRGEVGVYCFSHEDQQDTPYWRDVGTVHALIAARADMSSPDRPIPLPRFPELALQADQHGAQE